MKATDFLKACISSGFMVKAVSTKEQVKQAVKEFAEKLKERLCVFFDENENNDGSIDKGILLVDIIGVEAENGDTVSIGMIDDLLKEYENE